MLEGCKEDCGRFRWKCFVLMGMIIYLVVYVWGSGECDMDGCVVF